MDETVELVENVDNIVKIEGKRFHPPRAPMRILNEFRELKDYSNDSDYFRVFDYNNENVMQWTGLIVPKKYPYNHRAYKIEIELPCEYPQEPPIIKFLTKIYHPNISEEGDVKLEIIDKKNWKSTMRMDEVIQALIELIENPNAENESLIANEECAKLYKDENAEYEKKAAAFAKKNALRRPKPLGLRKNKVSTKNAVVEIAKPSSQKFVAAESLLEMATDESSSTIKRK